MVLVMEEKLDMLKPDLIQDRAEAVFAMVGCAGAAQLKYSKDDTILDDAAINKLAREESYVDLREVNEAIHKSERHYDMDMVYGPSFERCIEDCRLKAIARERGYSEWEDSKYMMDREDDTGMVIPEPPADLSVFWSESNELREYSRQIYPRSLQHFGFVSEPRDRLLIVACFIQIRIRSLHHLDFWKPDSVPGSVGRRTRPN